MKDLFALLERFSRSLNKDSWIKETISQVISDKTGATLKTETFSLKNGVLEISAGASLKNEIKLKEDLILAELKEARKIPVTRILYK